MSNNNKRIRILGIRGIPAKHGGFETFAQYLSRFLVGHDWHVTVYCQEQGREKPYTDSWEGVDLVHVPVRYSGSKGSILFDWWTTKDAARSGELILTLGYNTAVFCLLYRIKKAKNIINMDGIEWKREKWSFLARTWFYTNDWCGCLLGNHLVADHPEIANYLKKKVSSKKITVIPYGADQIGHGDSTLLEKYNLRPKEYSIVIARPEPENSILEIVQAFSQKKREHTLVILGEYLPDSNDYHKSVRESASDEVRFIGAIYDTQIVQTLRYFASLYIHGHQVGGTNPSLVEALGAGNPVLAHDNKFNRWVAGPNESFFDSMNDCSEKLTFLLNNPTKLESMHNASITRFQEEFTWEKTLTEYEKLFNNFIE
jgi:glycosyltransferase involved in cell wall biosynthesis